MVETIEVVVGRIGKPHGLRGEVTVEVRTDEPDRRFAPGTTLRAEPRGGCTDRSVPATKRRSGSSVRTSTVTSPRSPWGLPIRPITTSMVSTGSG